MTFINKIILVCATILLIAVSARGTVSAAGFATGTESVTPSRNKPQIKNVEPATPEKTKPLKAHAVSPKTSEDSGIVNDTEAGETFGKKKKYGEETKYKKSKEKKRVSATVQIERVGDSSASQVVTVTAPESEKKASKSSGRESAAEKSYRNKNGDTDVKYSSDTEVIQLAVEKAVDKKIAPLEDMIRDSQQRGPDFFTLLGFLGYIAGLLGLYSYIKSKQSKTKY
jgi:hypothetical protein